MSLIQVSPTTSQVESVNRRQILDRFLRETGLGQYGTVTAGTDATASINDTTNLKSTQFTTSDWVGGWARISKDAGGAGAAPENEHQPISVYEPATNGRITVNPVFSVAPTTNDNYQLWKYPNPTIVKDFLDQILKNNIYLPAWSPLSEIPDFDMEQANTTDWTASNATVTKVTGTEPDLYGKRWLSVVSTSANGYARTATFKVEPNKSYEISAIALPIASGTTAELQFWDVTNGALISSYTSLREFATRIAFSANTPAGCYEVQIRLVTQENAKTVLWDMIICYPVDSYDIALPWWVKDEAQVLGVFELDLVPVGSTTNVFDSVLQGNPTNNYDTRDDAFGRGQLRLVHRRKSGFAKPLFIFGIRNEVAFIDDNTDTKRIDDDLIFSCLAYTVFNHLKQQLNSGVLDTSWVRSQAAEYQKMWIQNERNQAKRLESTIKTYIGDSGYLDSRFRFGL